MLREAPLSRSDEALPILFAPAAQRIGPLMQLTGSSGRGRQYEWLPLPPSAAACSAGHDWAPDGGEGGEPLR